MEITTKYSVGDVVFAVRHESAHRIVACNVCEKGEFKIGEELFVCPKCHGRSARPEYAGTKYYIYGAEVIGQVNFEYTQEPRRFESDKPNPRITYMLRGTGVGSGTVWSEEDLFPSKESATQFCDGRNGLLNLVDSAEMLPAKI